MKFIQRLKYYGIGFGIGLLLVFVFFGGRGCSWTPENRIKDDLSRRIIVMTQADYDDIINKKLTKEDYLQVLKEGDVDFGKSIKHENPRFYLFTREKEGKMMYAQFEVRNNDAFVSLLRPLNEPKIKDTSMPKSARIISFPNDTLLVALDKNAEESALSFGLNAKSIQEALVRNGKVDYQQSDLSQEIKPLYCFAFVKNGVSYFGLANWYKDRILFKKVWKEGLLN